MTDGCDPEAGCSAEYPRAYVRSLRTDCGKSPDRYCRLHCASSRSHPRKRGPCSTLRHALLGRIPMNDMGRVEGRKRGPSGDLTPKTRMGSASTRRAHDRLHGRIPQAGPCSTLRRSLLHAPAHLPLMGREVFSLSVPLMGREKSSSSQKYGKSPSPSGGRLGWGWF